MPVVEFTLDSLKDLDGGKAWLAFQQHVRRAAADCLDRPGDGTARKVTLAVELKPLQEADGECSEVSARLVASSSVPKHTTKPYSFGLRKNGVLVFSEDSPTNVNQTTIFDNDQTGDED